MLGKEPLDGQRSSRAQFEVFSTEKGWTFHRGDHRQQDFYPKREAALAAARGAKETADRRRDAQHLSRVVQSEPLLRLAILRAGLNVLGRARVGILKPTTAQRERILAGRMGASLADDPEWEPPTAYREYVGLFDDLVAVDWDVALDALRANCDRLISVCVELLKEDAAGGQVNGYRYWQWLASTFAIVESGVDRTLDERIQNSPPTEQLAALRDVCALCEFRSHVHLVRSTLYDQYLTDLSTRPRVQTELCKCFLRHADDLRSAAADEVDGCRRAVAEVCRCARSLGVTLKGGIGARGAAYNFLGFSEMGGWDAFAALAADSGRSGAKSPGDPKLSSGPKMLSYADDHWLKRSLWDAIPVGARIYLPQGASRSPKGHRA